MLVTLLYNGEDVTDQVTNGVFTAPSLVRDAELTAVFADAPAAPDDKTYDISGIVTDASGNPIPGATLDMGGRTDVTRVTEPSISPMCPPAPTPLSSLIPADRSSAMNKLPSKKPIRRTLF